MPLSEQKKPDPLSKSQVKREMLALQQLGEDLVSLPLVQLLKLALPDNLLEAIHQAHSLKANEAKRRHLQYIGKLMRSIDPEPIQAALAKIKLADKLNLAHFHKIEEWRDKLITEGDLALQKLVEAYPQVDRQPLRQLIRRSQQDRARGKNSGAEGELFRYLRKLLQK